MKSIKIVTITVNPSLDKSVTILELIAEQKMRCEKPRYDAGGGGINVSKALSKLGATSTCIFTSGGSTGEMLKQLLHKEKIETIEIKTKNWTRENFIAFENKTKSQFRFGLPGNKLEKKEIEQLQLIIKNLDANFVVISGSLNEGLPTNFYATLIQNLKNSSSKVIIDTAGEALTKAIEIGAYLIKPNIGELAKLIGIERLEIDEVPNAAKKLIEKYNLEIVVVSLGAAGALLVTKEQSHFVKAPLVDKKSTVGAGDSMVAGMVWALSQKKSLLEVLKMGVCCGTAATMNEGTQLFTIEDVTMLLKQI